MMAETDDALDHVNDDDPPRPALPEEELPEDDIDLNETDKTGEDDSNGAGSSEPMPGWFKAVLLLAFIALSGAGYAGYLYLTGELSVLQNDTTGSSTPTPQSDGWRPPEFGESVPSTEGTSLTEPVAPKDAALDQGEASTSASGSGGYAINDTADAAGPQRNLDVSLPAPATRTPELARPSANSAPEAANDGETDAVLTDIRDSLATLQQELGEHRKELQRMNSLITNNELSIQQQNEDLSLLATQLKKANQSPRQSSPNMAQKRATPTLEIALVSMLQMGSAQTVGVRYRGHPRRLQLGQSLDGWRLSSVQVDRGIAQFTHASTGHTVTVAL